MNKMKIIVVIFFIYLPIFAQVDTAIVFLGDIDSSFVYDVRYATENNFTGKILYQSTKIFLRKSAADSLKKVNEYLKNNYNLRLKIFDGYRPLSVQNFMWSVFPDENYVANPSKGSRHNRGAAVDLTLVDMNSKELNMGTEYDDFTEKAHSNYKNLPEQILKNRNILINTMQRFGFHPIETEWWHFDFKDWKNYSVLDIEIK